MRKSPRLWDCICGAVKLESIAIFDAIAEFVFHASEPWFGLLMISTGIDGANMLSFLGLNVVMSVTAISVVLYNGIENLSRVNQRIGMNTV